MALRTHLSPMYMTKLSPAIFLDAVLSGRITAQIPALPPAAPSCLAACTAQFYPTEVIQCICVDQYSKYNGLYSFELLISRSSHHHPVGLIICCPLSAIEHWRNLEASSRSTMALETSTGTPKLPFLTVKC